MASLLRESLYKRQNDSHTRVVHWCNTCGGKKKLGVLKNKRLRFDKKKKKNLHIITVHFSAVVSSGHDRSQTCFFYGVKRLPLQYGSQVGTSPGQTHTGRKQLLIKSKSCTSFYKRQFFCLFVFKESLQEVLCSFDIQTDKPNSSFRGNDERLVGLKKKLI